MSIKMPLPTPVENYMKHLDKWESVPVGFHEIRGLDPSVTLMALAAVAAKVAAASGGVAAGAVVGHHIGKKMIGASTDNKGGHVFNQPDVFLIEKLRSTGTSNFILEPSMLISSRESTVEDIFELRRNLLQ